MILAKRAFTIVGVSLLLMGLVIFLSSLQGITGYVVLEPVESQFGFYAGTWFVIAGLAVLLIGKSRD